jgi:hypothetical protein
MGSSPAAASQTLADIAVSLPRETLKRAVWPGSLFASPWLVALLWVRLFRRRVAAKTCELQAAMERLAKEF